MRALAFALLIGGSALATPAHAAVLPGPPPCPTLITPPPCIVIDKQKISQFVTKLKGEQQKAQAALRTVQGYRATGDALGRTLGPVVGNLKAPPPGVAARGLLPATSLERQIVGASSLPQAIEAAAARLVTVPGRTGAQKEAIARQTASTAYATAVQTKFTHGPKAESAAKDLAKAASSSTSIREDFALNSRVRLEYMRQKQIGDALMATLIQMRAANTARAQRPVPALTRWTVTRPVIYRRVGNSSDAWVKAFELDKLASAASRIAASASVVKTLRDTQQDLAQLGQVARTAERAKAKALADLQRYAVDIAPRRGAAGTQRLAAALDAIPQGYQNAIASGRATAAGLGELRGITAADRAAGFDPRLVVGTWYDPMKDDDARTVATNIARTGAFGDLSGDQRKKLGNLAAAYQDAKLFADYATQSAADAQAMYNQIERSITATEAARGVDLDGPAWKAAVDRLDVAALPLEQSLSRLPSTAGDLADDVRASKNRLNRAAALD